MINYVSILGYALTSLVLSGLSCCNERNRCGFCFYLLLEQLGHHKRSLKPSAGASWKLLGLLHSQPPLASCVFDAFGSFRKMSTSGS